MTASAKRRADAATSRKAATEARKHQIGEISKKRNAIEEAKVGARVLNGSLTVVSSSPTR